MYTKRRRVHFSLGKIKHRHTKKGGNKYNDILKSKKLNLTQKYDKLVNLQCSPISKQIHNKRYTCLPDDVLLKLREMWNVRHPDVMIHSKSPEDIWYLLKQFLGKTCNKETCWLKQHFTNGQMKKVLDDMYAPKSPDEWKRNPNEWLSSVDIMNVMRQYEDAYKCFNFIGPSPIDYDTHKINGECVWEELCEFSLNDEIKKNITKIGIIFNLDPHYKGGSHWVSLFVNIKKADIYYFDSAGEKIPKQIMKLVEKITEQGKQLHPPIQFNFDQNHPVEHQFGNTECGVYSLFFIIFMLRDKITGRHLKKKIYKDKFIEQYRKIFFNEDL
jgi:hypothetical protein